MSKFVKYAFIIMLASFVFLNGCSGDDPDHNKVREAIQLKKEGKFNEAIAIYDQLIAKGVFKDEKDNLAIIYYNRALVEVERGNLQTAVDNYSEALKLRPVFPTCLHNRSVVYEKIGDYEKAIADVEAVLKLEPDDEDAKKRLEHLASLNSAK